MLFLSVILSLLTLKILFWPDSTEGVETEQITALREEKEWQRRQKQQGQNDGEE